MVFDANCCILCLARRLTLNHQFTNNVFIDYKPRRPGRTPASGEQSNALPQIVVGDFGNAARDGDNETMIPLNVIGGQGPEDTELRIWEDTYGVGNILRKLCQAHLPYEDGGVGTADWCERRPDNIRMADLSALDESAPDFSDQLVGLLGGFEWELMETGTEISELDDPVGDVTATSRWIVDTLYPAARDRVAAYRNPSAGRPAGYFDALDVSWTRPQTLMPFVYNTGLAAVAGDAGGDQDGEGQGANRHDEDGSDVVRMRQLGTLHEWDDVKPVYELRSLEFNRPTMKPLKNQPADGDGSDDGGG